MICTGGHSRALAPTQSENPWGLASRVPCDPKVWPHPEISIAIWILLGPAEIASISVSLTRLPPECPTLGQVFRKTDRKGVLTVSCHHLVGTVVALGQAGKPQKWVHKENLSCSLISLHFPAEGAGGRTCSALVMAQHMVWGVQHPQPHTRTVPCPVTPAQAMLSVSALAKTMARCCCLARKCLFPAPASTQGGNLLPQGASPLQGGTGGCWGRWGQILQNHPSTKVCIWSRCSQVLGSSCSQPHASAALFGSWIFIAGLPSDERPIIHPVIAHSYLDLGLSHVLGNIFLDTATIFPAGEK